MPVPVPMDVPSLRDANRPRLLPPRFDTTQTLEEERSKEEDTRFDWWWFPSPVRGSTFPSPVKESISVPDFAIGPIDRKSLELESTKSIWEELEDPTEPLVIDNVNSDPEQEDVVSEVEEENIPPFEPSGS